MASKISLTDDEIQKCLESYAKTKNPAAREKIVYGFRDLIQSIAWKYAGKGEPVEDLVQEGYIGLLAAITQYDKTKGAKFSTYAMHIISGQIQHHLRDRGRMIKEPAWLQELSSRMRKTVLELTAELNREPDVEEIAKAMNLAADSVRNLLSSRKLFQVSSLDDGSISEKDFQSLHPETIHSAHYEDFRLPIEDRILLEESLRKLKEWERKVIYEFFFMDLNQSEIARKFDISGNYASYLLRNGIRRLKKIMASADLVDSQMQAHQIPRLPEVEEEPIILDKVTGIYSGHYLESRLDEEMNRACRDGVPVSILMLRINGLDSCKTITTRQKILKQIGQEIKNGIRRSDIAGRYEENDFVVLLPRTGEHARIVMARLTEKLSVMNFSEDISITIRNAIITYPQETAGSSHELLAHAITNLSLQKSAPTPVGSAAA